MFYSFIIPLYNRPDEIQELLESLTRQTFRNFEVLVIEDGSKIKAEDVVNNFKSRLDVRYFFKENSGQGFTRNYGFKHARGDFFIILDSDCIVPEHYLSTVDKFLKTHQVDAFGGPDASHPSFTAIQKAISYAMTSLFTTGGIRGRKKHIGPYHPRSFNMGISRKVYEKTGGFRITRMGEDIIFSIEIINAGFKTALIEDAFVYHKRRTDFKRFYQQLKFFGRARINVYTFYPKELKAVHFFPALYTLFCVFGILSVFIDVRLFIAFWLFTGFYCILIFIDSLWKNKDLSVALLSIMASFIQLIGYGLGFMEEFWKRIIKKEENKVTEYPG